MLQDELNIICYDFVPQLLSLLQDPELCCEANLVLNWDHPLSAYVPPNGRLGEIHSGSVYRKMRDVCITDPT